ncbi:MAG: transposase [Actinopolymorphaceae bacterium]
MDLYADGPVVHRCVDRHDLADEEWQRLEPLLPDRAPCRGGRWQDHRPQIDGVLWRTPTGSPWRDLPSCYGNWRTVYNRHRRWSADGTLMRVLAELRRGCDCADADGGIGVPAAGTEPAVGHRLSPRGRVTSAVNRRGHISGATI